VCPETPGGCRPTWLRVTYGEWECCGRAGAHPAEPREISAGRVESWIPPPSQRERGRPGRRHTRRAP
jgi:hypothetical protein